MNFEVDRFSSAWAHVALCADLTWASEPSDEFIAANQRLWTQNCRVSQLLQENTIDPAHRVKYDQSEISDTLHKHLENGGCIRRKSVKDVIPKSRLAQFYGNFYYNESRENCYKSHGRKLEEHEHYNDYGSKKSNISESWMLPEVSTKDVKECWMLPEVEYWFNKLVEDTPERKHLNGRKVNNTECQQTIISSERWGLTESKSAEESRLEARVRSVRALWSQNRGPQNNQQRIPSPPPASRKIRARRRQPRRLGTLAPPPPAYCLDLSTQLLCDPSSKFDVPRPQQTTDCQRAIGRISVSMQAMMRAAASRCLPYRGTQVSRYAPTGSRPLRCPDKRCRTWWPRDHLSPRLDHRFEINHVQCPDSIHKNTSKSKAEAIKVEPEGKDDKQQTEQSDRLSPDKPEPIKQSPREKVVSDGQEPTTSAVAKEMGRKRRLYSTVLSTSAPTPINLNSSCLRLPQKLMTPGLIKLNPKILLSTRVRTPNVDKFEELEKEALEQYEASDESIDTKFNELEKQAVEQYSTSNSNTSCSSDNSSKKKQGKGQHSKLTDKMKAILRVE